ncbi:MAG: hypothetical protein U5L01_07440 [Rheinheimera sp.]|nr:hypothetical protein [Rheinheimera sp.]
MPEDKVDMTSMYAILNIEEVISNNFEPLSAEHESSLNDMLNSTSAIVSTRALRILIERGGFEYTEPIIEDDKDERSTEILQTSDQRSFLESLPQPSGRIVGNRISFDRHWLYPFI